MSEIRIGDEIVVKSGSYRGWYGRTVRRSDSRLKILVEITYPGRQHPPSRVWLHEERLVRPRTSEETGS